MEDWQKDLTEWINDVTVAVEGFVDEVGQSMETAVEDFHNDLVREIDPFLDDVFTPIIDISMGEESQTYYYYYEYNQDPESILSPKIEPTHNIHPACRGCVHYHGRLYGNNLFVCGMYPYGSNSDSCPDWEGTSKHQNSEV